MSWLDILDVAIGVTFMFLLLSLMAGALTEMLSWFMSWRSKMLESWIKDLINAPQQPVGRFAALVNLIKDDANRILRFFNLAPAPAPATGRSAVTTLPRDLYQHPLIDNLVTGETAARPSYIPAEAFARALIDILARRVPVAGAPPNPLAPLPAAAPPPGYSPTSTPLPNAPAHLTNLRDALGHLAVTDPVRRWLEPLVVEAGADAEKLKKNIETYFDSAMERLSGWYKRKAYLALLFFGAIITGVLAIDTIEVAKYLSTNKTARELLVKNASDFLEANPPKQAAPPQAPQAGAGGQSGQSTSPANASDNTAGAKLPIECPPKKTGDAGTNKNPDDADKLADCYQYLQKTLMDQQYPIGWGSLQKRWENIPQKDSRTRFFFVVQTVFGAIFTVLAIAMGSNFWFDSLRNLMNLRAAGKRPTNGKGGKET